MTGFQDGYHCKGGYGCCFVFRYEIGHELEEVVDVFGLDKSRVALEDFNDNVQADELFFSFALLDQFYDATEDLGHVKCLEDGHQLQEDVLGLLSHAFHTLN